MIFVNSNPSYFIRFCASFFSEFLWKKMFRLFEGVLEQFKSWKAATQDGAEHLSAP